MHSTTYRRLVKRLEAARAIEQRASESITSADHYTDEDRRVAEQQEARSLRARISRADSRLFPARRQMALRRIQSVLWLAEKNPEYAQDQLAEAKLLAEGILQG